MKDELASPNTTGSDVLGGLASTLLTAGIVSLLYEWQIREAVANDLFRLVGLDSGIREARLAKLSVRRPDASGFLSDGPKHLHVVVDVEKWFSEEWPRVLVRAEQGPMDLVVVLPAQNSETAAHRLGIDPREHTDRTIRVENSIEKEWKRETSEGRMHPGSSLVVYDVKDCPPYEVRRTQAGLWLLLQPPLGKRLAPPKELVMNFTLESGSIGADILDELVRNIENLNLVWSVKVDERGEFEATT